MGGMVVFGGYWIFILVDYIVVNLSIFIGFIGIFGVINIVENIFGLIGVYIDGVVMLLLVDVFSIKVLLLEVQQLMQLSIENGYQCFIILVVNVCKSMLEKIDQIVQGYVWIGEDVKVNGLVDSFGDFDDVVVKVVELVKLKIWYFNYYQEELIFFLMVLDSLIGLVCVLLLVVIQVWLFVLVVVVVEMVKVESDKLVVFNDLQNCYVFCLICVNIC